MCVNELRSLRYITPSINTLRALRRLFGSSEIETTERWQGRRGQLTYIILDITKSTLIGRRAIRLSCLLDILLDLFYASQSWE